MRRFAFLLFTATASTVRAQTQTNVPPGAPASLSGIVRNAAGSPLSEVSVTLTGETEATRTDSSGRFDLRDVPPGNHAALFRRIGYQSVEYRWVGQPSSGLQIAVTMKPAPRLLDRVVIAASGTSRRRGTSSIGGTVVDSAGAPVAEADVRLLGSGLSSVTDSSGRFAFETLVAGAYIVRARRRGLTSANYVMQIADDDSRGITLKLYGLSRKTNPRDTATASGYGGGDAAFDAFDRRERTGSRHPILGPADLFRANRASLDFVLQPYGEVASSRDGRMSRAGPDGGGDCLLIDGRRPVYRPLRSFTSVEIQLVEAFRANAPVDDFIVSQMETITECRGSAERHPSYFVLWTRALR